MTWVDELLDNYYKWLRERTFTQQDAGSDWVLINTPFVGMYNDMIELYAKNKDGKILLSDDGKTLGNLELMGVSPHRSANRRGIVDKIMRTHGIRLNDNSGELSVETDIKNFSQKKHDIVTAITELSELYVLSTGSIASIFKEDVETFLKQKEIVYTPDFIARGSTGLEFMFDFQIAGKSKEIVIKAFNSTTKLNTMSFLFSWEDIKENREALTHKSVTAVAVLNDTTDKDIRTDYIEALESKGAQVLRWSKRNEPDNLKKLAA